MRKLAVSVAIVICAISIMATAMASSAVTRIKDVAKVQGVRTNQLVGYGLVTGLALILSSKQGNQRPTC